MRQKFFTRVAPLNETKKHKVFVYGTLRKGGTNHVLLQYATPLEMDVRVNGYAMYGNFGFPYTVPSTNSSDSVVGEIYAISDSELARLDALEGYPHHYTRIPLSEKYPDVFIYTPKHTDVVRRIPKIESGDWINHIKSNKRQYMFDDDDWVTYLPKKFGRR